MQLLKQLYAVHSPSGQEQNIRKFIKQYVCENIPSAEIANDKIGNIYITKGVSDTYPCIVAHLDQVQKLHSKDFRAIETQDIIFGYSASNRRQEGLGADDKNGIWIALQCLMKYDTLKVAFFVGEEVGCIGSSAADLSFFSDCRFVIEPDRRGHSDLITEIGWISLCSDEFATGIQPERFGYKPTDGLMTDIETLRDNGLAISCINLSCGYYEPHTDREFTVKRDLLNCLDFVQHIIEHCTAVYAHEPQEDPYAAYYDDDYMMEEALYEMIMAHPDYTAEDMWDVYQTNFPYFSHDEFISICEEFASMNDFELPTESTRPVRKLKQRKKRSKRKSQSVRSSTYCFPAKNQQNSNWANRSFDF